MKICLFRLEDGKELRGGQQVVAAFELLLSARRGYMIVCMEFPAWELIFGGLSGQSMIEMA